MTIASVRDYYAQSGLITAIDNHHDFACLNKMEMTPWDSWGLSAQPYEELKEEALQKLDFTAELTLSLDDSFSQLRELYDSDVQLKVPAQVTSYTVLDERTTEIIYRE